MSKYFSIDGYWKDDESEFEGYIVKEFEDTEPTDVEDEKIFFYGLSEPEIQYMIGNPDNGVQDFVITSYQEVDKP
jgi:hypothetical protein